MSAFSDTSWGCAAPSAEAPMLPAITGAKHSGAWGGVGPNRRRRQQGMSDTTRCDCLCDRDDAPWSTWQTFQHVRAPQQHIRQLQQAAAVAGCEVCCRALVVGYLRAARHSTSCRQRQRTHHAVQRPGAAAMAGDVGARLEAADAKAARAESGEGTRAADRTHARARASPGVRTHACHLSRPTPSQLDVTF